jgi:maltose/moltooligosaccharide transporter
MATPALTAHLYDAPSPRESLSKIDPEAFELMNSSFQKAADAVGSNMGVYGLTSMLFALALTFYAAKYSVNRKWVHLLSLVAGGLGFILMSVISGPEYLWFCFALIGFAWGSILSMPYAMLTGCLPPNKIGIYMGIFNFFIVLPEIIASLFFGYVMTNLLDGSRMAAVTVGGILLITAALVTLLISEDKSTEEL